MYWIEWKEKKEKGGECQDKNTNANAKEKER
jgi:hypothetical protein